MHVPLLQLTNPLTHLHTCSLTAHSAGQVYTLLGDDSASIRHAVAELVAGMLEEQGEKALKQVGGVWVGAMGQWICWLG